MVINLRVNGVAYSLEVSDKWTLLRLLRERLGLTGAKDACGTGDCGACKVLVNGEAVNSCTIPVSKMEGAEVLTIEGLAEPGDIHPIQEAFIKAGAIQCGYCTPAMIMTGKALLDRNPHPTREEITEAIDENLCRCTGYKKIIDAVEAAAKELQDTQETGRTFVSRKFDDRVLTSAGTKGVRR